MQDGGILYWGIAEAPAFITKSAVPMGLKSSW